MFGHFCGGLGLTVLLSLGFAWAVNSFGNELEVVRGQFGQTWQGWLSFIFAPILCAGLLSMLVGKYLPRTSKSPKSLQSIVHVFESNRAHILGTEIAAFFVLSVVSLSAGVSLGRFGPCVALGAMTANFLGSKFGFVNEDVLSLSAACAAAAVTTSLGTPLAAIAFAVEVSKSPHGFNFRSLLIFVVIGFISGRFFGASPRMLTIIENESWRMFSSVSEVALAVAIGICSYILSQAFSLLYDLCIQARHFVNPKVTLNHFGGGPVLGALALTLIYLACPFAAGTSESTVRHSLGGSSSPSDLGAIIVFKMLATCVSLSAGFQGGTTGPCLVMGCCVGSALLTVVSGYGVHLSVAPHVAASAGAAAMVSAVINLPLFAIIFTCELFDSFHGVIFVLLATTVAYSLTSLHASTTSKHSETDVMYS